jgi:hypothetical protein
MICRFYVLAVVAILALSPSAATAWNRPDKTIRTMQVAFQTQKYHLQIRTLPGYRRSARSPWLDPSHIKTND